jgi:preprotein translocase subunit SecD
MDSFWPEIRDALAAERDVVGFVTREEGPADRLSIRIGEEAGAARALEIVRGLAQPVATLTGGAASDIEASIDGTLLTVALSEAERAATDNRTVLQALEIVRNRIDEVGTREPTILRQGEDRILIQVPGVGSAQEVKDLIGTTAQLTFRPVVGSTGDAGADPGPGQRPRALRGRAGVFYVLERAPVVTGEELVDAQPAFDQNGGPGRELPLQPQGARPSATTRPQRRRPFAIVLRRGGDLRPRDPERHPRRLGHHHRPLHVEESTNLAVLLRAGALPAELTFLEERTIGPELGQDSIDAGRNAAYAAAVAVVLFMLASYGAFGLVAIIALAINIVLIFGLLSLIGATLTLPGIAGIVLTMGQAVDANVLIYERMREELRRSPNPYRAVEEGFAKALSAIVDANVTTMIIAGIMFFVGAGPVRGFAVTLAIGVVTTIITGIYVTRFLISAWFARTRPKTIVV